MKSTFTSSLKAIIALLISLSALSLSASGQEAKTSSRVAVVANETKTKIWVSDFPKNATVVIMDSEDNMLTMITTNQYGAAYVALPAGTSKVTVKTLDGGVIASNFTKAAHEESVASNDDDDSTIA